MSLFLKKTLFFLKKINPSFLCFSLFFLAWFFLGSTIYSDYGISWDETIEVYRASVMWDFVIGKSQAFLTDPDRFHGAFFRWIMALSSHYLGFTSSREGFLFRHFLCFLLHTLGLSSLMFACHQRFKNTALTLLFGLCFILSPRIFADGFYNPKDMPFMVMMILSAIGFHFFFKHRSFSSAILYGLISGLSISTRILGLMVPAITVGFSFLIIKKKPSSWMRESLMMITYLVSTLCFTVLLWPILWTGNPFATLLSAFSHMSAFPWNGTVLYFGQFIPATQLPWHYAFVWIGLTLPLWTLSLGMGGIFIYCKQCLKDTFKKNLEPSCHMMDHFWVASIVISFLMILLLKPVLYDGWRHLYYLYPGFLWLCLLAIQKIWEWKKWLLCFLLVSLFFTGIEMVKIHPYQNVFFNVLAGKNVEEKFDMDYWGLSFYEALRYVTDHSDSPSIPIAVSNNAGIYAAYLLPFYTFQRIQFTTLEHAHYFIGNFRWHPYAYSEKAPDYAIYAGDYCLAVVYKLSVK